MILICNRLLKVVTGIRLTTDISDIIIISGLCHTHKECQYGSPRPQYLSPE
jgi:hypothetical protein